MTDLNELRFFQTSEHDCSYLPNKDARNVFVDPEQTLDAGLYAFLSSYGFRRSGTHVYRPHCETCHACQPLRVVTEAFQPSRAQLRCLKRNADLRAFQMNSIDTDECYALYEKYIRLRHSDGDMYPPTRQQYKEFLSKEWGATRYVGFKDPDDRLISIAVVDCLHNGLSAMYSFYDPDCAKRSLGVHNILYQILWARDQELPFVYLGYLIKGCQKMEYKQEYRPHQLLIDNQWVSVDD